MINTITWQEYLTALAMLSGGYYLIIGGVFYHREIGTLLRRKKTQETTHIAIQEEEEAAVHQELEAMLGDLKRSVLEQAGMETSKAQLLLQLKARLVSYRGLRHPAFQDAVTAFIMDQAKQHCGVVFSEEELDAAWETLPR